MQTDPKIDLGKYAGTYGGYIVVPAQTKLGSFYEACINVVIGFSINFIANLLVLPLFGYTPSLLDNLWIGIIYTGISLVRSYAIRRYFNDRITNAANTLAGRARSSPADGGTGTPASRGAGSGESR